MNRSCPTYASEKARNILTFYLNSFFSLKIASIMSFPAFLGELTSYLRKTNFFFSSEKKNICHFTKKLPFHRKSEFFHDFFYYFIVFIKKNKQKTRNIATIYFLLEKKIINDVFFNVFRSINGILHKTPFYKYNICDLNYPFFNVFQGFTIFL